MAALISYEEFSKTDDYQGFVGVNPKQGSLKVMAFTAYQAIPIENAEIIITKEIGGNNVLFFRGYTDSSGIIDNITLPAPTSGYDDNSFQTSSTTSYKLTAIKDKYDSVKQYIINMIGDVKVLQYIKMTPITDKGETINGN
ncbi:MAG: hypothetical protein PUF66_04770 [Clostridium sp.]|nr:hypothetical protein [Clostridium sp.]